MKRVSGKGYIFLFDDGYLSLSDAHKTKNKKSKKSRVTFKVIPPREFLKRT